MAESVNAVDLAALEAALAAGDRHGAERLALAAWPEGVLETLADAGVLAGRAPEEPLADRLLDVMEDSAAATRCAVRPSGITPDTVHNTVDAYRDSSGRWDLERERLHDEIVRDMLAGVPESETPTIYMTGGGPASGKSSMLSSGNVSVPTRTSAVIVDADAIKERLPEYMNLIRLGDERAAAFVHEESSYLVKRVSTEASLRRLNMVLDTTGDGSIEHLASKLAPLRVEGHRVVAFYASNDTELAVRLAAERGAKIGRHVPENFIRDTHAGVSRTLPEAVKRGLFDEVTLYDTNVLGEARLVMSGRGKEMTIHNEALWQQFLDKGK